MPFGYLVTVTFVAGCTLLALGPPRPRHSSPSNKSFWFGYLLNELPFLAFYWLLASTLLAFSQGDLASPGGWAALGVAVLTTVGLVIVAWRGLGAGPAVDHALDEGLGGGWRATVDPELAGRLRRHLPWARIVLWPLPLRRRDVERVATSATATPATKPARPVPPSLPSAAQPDARLLPWRRVPQRRQAPRGAAPPPPAGQPGLGLHQRQLPPEPDGQVP